VLPGGISARPELGRETPAINIAAAATAKLLFLMSCTFPRELEITQLARSEVMVQVTFFGRLVGLRCIFWTSSALMLFFGRLDKIRAHKPSRRACRHRGATRRRYLAKPTGGWSIASASSGLRYSRSNNAAVIKVEIGSIPR